MRPDDWRTNRKARERARLVLAARTDWRVQGEECWTHCTVCGVRVDVDSPWVCGHIKPRSLYPHLMWLASNHRVECRRCSDAQGGRMAGVFKRSNAVGWVVPKNPSPREGSDGISGQNHGISPRSMFEE